MNVMTAFTAESAYGTYGRHDRIRVRRGIIGCGEGFTVALDEAGGVRYAGENRWGQKDAALWQDMLSVYCGPDFVLGICRDGGVLSAGRSAFHGINVKSWACVSTIACGQRHAAALISNGQILASGDNRFGQCDTASWQNMIDVCCGRTFTVGLKSDGTLLSAGGGRLLHHALERWPRVAGVFTDEEGKQVMAITYGEGRLLSTAHLPSCTKKWRNLVFVAASARGVVGITAQGRLLSSNKKDAQKLERLEKDYSVCAMGPGHLAVVCRNGEVISEGRNEFGQCATTRWGRLFKGFEAFSNRRREEEQQKEKTEKLYQQRLTEANRHSRRLVCGERLTACIQADGHVSATAGLRNVKSWRNVCDLSSGSAHLLALHKDGTVSAEGNNVGGCCRVRDWKRIKSIRTGKYHSLGLCEDGTVMFSGWNVHGQGNVTEWRGIRLLRSTDTYTVGVDASGKIYASGKKLPFDPEKLDMNEWKELVDLALSEHHMVGLRKDGRVVGVGDSTLPDRTSDGKLTELSDWQGVRAIAVGDGFTAGLCYGGHVLTAGKNDFGQCDTETWTNVVSIGCGRTFTAALTADGQVLTAGQHMSGQGQNLSADEVSEAVMAWEKAESTGYEPFHTEWMTNILSMKCGREHLVTVDRYGQVMAEGLDLDGQCTSAATFVLFRDVNQLDGFGIFTTAADLLPLHDSKADREPLPKTYPKEDDSLGRKASDREINTVAGTLYKTHTGLEKLQRLNQAYLQRISCGDDHLTVIGSDGYPIVCDVATESLRFLSEADGIPMMASLSSQRHRTAMAARDGTPWVYSHHTGKTERLPYLPEHRRCNVKDIVVGKEHTAVLFSDGTVYAFGENDDGRCDTQSWRNVISVALGERHTVGLTADGRVLSTGSHNREDKKNLLYTLRNDPCHTGTWTDIKRVVCGYEITCGLKSNGEVVAVGKNAYGQCRTEAWRDVVELAVSGSHTVGLLQDGHVVAVGRNDHGECNVSEWEHIISIGAFSGMTVGLTADGRVLSAGRRKGALKISRTVYAMGVFGNRQVFVLSDGTLAVCTGDQERVTVLPQKLSLFEVSPEVSVLDRVDSSLPWDMVARSLLGCVGQGILHSLYLTDHGTVKTTDALNRLPAEAAQMEGVRWISSGLYHTIAVTKDGGLCPFGKVPEGQEPGLLDDLAAKEASSHEAICWQTVTCGTHHTAAVTTNGRVYAIGQNDCGQCRTDGFTDVAMVACGLKHTVAMTHDGRAMAVGDDTHGQCQVGEWKDLAMVACGEGHTVGLFRDGRVEAVGDNRLGQCRLDKAEKIISVACLPEATVCVSADGRVAVYGGTGEFRDRVALLTDIVAVFAREYRLSVLTSDGRLISVN